GRSSDEFQTPAIDSTERQHRCRFWTSLDNHKYRFRHDCQPAATAGIIGRAVLVLGEGMQLLGLLLLLLAQEGHPLVGTWHGDWGPTATHRNDVTLVLDWDGKNITGLINPGPESIKLSKAALEPSSDPKAWTVHFEADAKDHDGKPVHFMID